MDKFGLKMDKFGLKMDKSGLKMDKFGLKIEQIWTKYASKSNIFGHCAAKEGCKLFDDEFHVFHIFKNHYGRSVFRF